MKSSPVFRLSTLMRFSLLTVTTLLLSVTHVTAQCPVTQLTSGLQLPIGIAQSNKRNLLISESGPRGTTNTGSISIVGLDGTRRTLLDGLPSGPNDIGDPSGPAGLFMRGRTLYVAIGMGDVVVPVVNAMTGLPIPGAGVPNPNGPSSPIFSSILSVHFSAHVEMTTEGLTLSLADQQALAAGEKVTLSEGNGDSIALELVTNFPDYIPNPLPTIPGNVRHSNPFDLLAIDDGLYVTDGARNLAWEVDIPTGAFSVLAEFPPVSNPLPIGAPTVEAVPTGIAHADGQLLVTLFRGFPFPAGTSVVEQVDAVTGDHAPFISGLRTAVDVLAITGDGDVDYLVLQHSSVGGAPLPPFANSGRVLRFEEPGSAPTVVAEGPNCLIRPTAMTLDKKTGTLYVIEYSGRVLSISGVNPAHPLKLLSFPGKQSNQ